MSKPASPGAKPAAADGAKSTGPWWRYAMMWLVVGGPLVVVVASVVTAVIAIKGADIIVDDGGSARTGAHVPAVKARNHAATPDQK